MFNRRRLDDVSHYDILNLSRRHVVVDHAPKRDVVHRERAFVKDVRLRLLY